MTEAEEIAALRQELHDVRNALWAATRGAEASPWMRYAVEELARGVAELSGSRHAARILEYHATTSLAARDDETPWCSSFVNWCVTRAGLVGTNSAAAGSWKAWGKPIAQPAGYGDLAVLTRVGGHHVGFVVAREGQTILLVGGNQGNRVSVAPYPASRVLALRRP